LSIWPVTGEGEEKGKEEGKPPSVVGAVSPSRKKKKRKGEEKGARAPRPPGPVCIGRRKWGGRKKGRGRACLELLAATTPFSFSRKGRRGEERGEGGEKESPALIAVRHHPPGGIRVCAREKRRRMPWNSCRALRIDA